MPPLSSASDANPPHPFRLRYTIPLFEAPETLGSRAYKDAETVPQGYGNAPFGPDSGTVAGIVLGSVAGFVLLLVLIYWCAHIGPRPRIMEERSVGGAASSVISWRTRPRGPPRKHHRRSKHAPRREKVEIRRARTTPVRLERDDEIVVEEYGSRSRSQSRSRSRPRLRDLGRGPPAPSTVMSDGDDVIVVEEDHHSPPRRRDSMRSQRTRSDDRRDVYREDIYTRDVNRRRSRSRA